MTPATARPHRFGLPRLGRRTVAVLLAVLVVLLGGFLWVRDSSLVAVRQVTVTGLYGPQVTQIRQALVNQALTMTTLDVDTGALQSVVRAYSNVASLSVHTDFPHGLTIAVTEEVPLATVSGGSGAPAIPVDRQGSLLRSRTVPAGSLPVIPLSYEPGGSSLVTPGSRMAVATLAAAPYAILAHVRSATWSTQHGVILQLKSGPQLYFGTTDDLGAKWISAIGALANASSRGASYIDVSDPRRPAAGV